MKNTKEKNRSIALIIFSTLLLAAVLVICFFLPDMTYGAESGYVTVGDLNVRSNPDTSNSQVVGMLSYENVTILDRVYDSSGNLWYKISYNDGEYYIFGAYVTVSSGNESTPEPAQSTATGSYEEQLLSFPECYRSLIEEIHKVYPNYIFQADYVDISFDEAVYQQTLEHRKLVSMSYDGVSWRSLSPSCYNKATKTWSTFSGNWTDAGIDVIEYYMDPRNFLTTRNMYIFAKQTYSGTESRSGVESIVAGSFLAGNYTDSTGTHNYVDTIMEVAAESKVSPYVIAATLRIEQPTGGDSPLIDGSYDYYNFFNFGASGSDVVGNGISFAKSQGWDTVYKSILGGAKGYYNGYLQDGQDTYFYKDFNLINGNYWHQYAQGVYDPIGSGSFLRNAIGSDTNATLILRIPVYTSMPATPPEYPAETSSLNPRYNADGTVIARSTETIDTSQPQNSSSALSAEPSQKGSESQTPAETPQEQQKTTPSETTQTAYAAGDANGDGSITSMDYITVKNHIMGTKLITDANKLKAADANGDGVISSLDYVRIKNTIMGR